MGENQISRRSFLKRSAGTLVGTLLFPYFVPASALGKNGFTVPSDRITMGCIGLGGQGTYNMRNFIQQPDAQVIALCDVDRGSTDYGILNAGSYFGLEPALKRALDEYARQNRPVNTESISLYTDFRELLAREDIDAVTVCTPDHWHGLITIAAAKAGKDIYCEKPLVNSIPEGRAVCEAVKCFGRVLQTGSHERSNDSVRFACELVRNGRIGELRTIEINMPNSDQHHKWILSHNQPQPEMPVPKNLDYDMWLGPAPWRPYTQNGVHFFWRFILDFGGGEMTDRGAHIIDIAQLANNTDNSGPIEIKGVGKAPKTGIYDCFMDYQFECWYANGVRLIGSSKGERGLKLVGSEGWIFIHIHGGRLEAEPKSLLREKIGPDDIHIGRSPGHHRNFLDCVKTRNLPVAHAEIGHRTATICHLLNIAYLTGRPIKWDPVKEHVVNDPEVQRLVNRPMRTPWHV